MKAVRLFFYVLTFLLLYISPGNTQNWNLDIKGYLSGFKVGIAKGKFIKSNDKILLEIKAETVGITKLFFPWEQTIVVEALLLQKEIRPNFYRVDDLREKTKKGHMELTFKNGLAEVTSAMPSIISDSRRKPVPKELIKNVLDPASAIIALGYMSGIANNCNHKIKVFDGRRRFNLFTEDMGIEELTPSVFTDSSGEALKCKFFIKKIAGYSDKELKKHPKSGYIWLQKLQNSNIMMFPVKVQMAIGKGHFVTHLSVKN